MKTRISAQVNEKPCQFVSIEERPSGDLLICLARNYYETSELSFPKMSERGFSVHVSPDSNGHTITHFTGLHDREGRRTRSVIETNPHPFLWPLFSKRFANPTNDFYAFKAKKNDTVEWLPAFDQSKNNLFMHVIVSLAGTDLSWMKDIGFGYWMKDYSYFKVTILTQFCPYRSIEQGDIFMLENSPERDRMPSMCLNDLIGHISIADRRLRELLFKRLHEDYFPFQSNFDSSSVIELIETAIGQRRATPYNGR